MAKRGSLPRNAGKSMNFIHTGYIRTPTGYSRLLGKGKKTSNRRHVGGGR